MSRARACGAPVLTLGRLVLAESGEVAGRLSVRFTDVVTVGLWVADVAAALIALEGGGCVSDDAGVLSLRAVTLARRVLLTLDHVEQPRLGEVAASPAGYRRDLARATAFLAAAWPLRQAAI